MIPKKTQKDHTITAPLHSILMREAKEIIKMFPNDTEAMRAFIIRGRFYSLESELPSADMEDGIWVGVKPYIRVFTCKIKDLSTFTIGKIERPPKEIKK